MYQTPHVNCCYMGPANPPLVTWWGSLCDLTRSFKTRHTITHNKDGPSTRVTVSISGSPSHSNNEKSKCRNVSCTMYVIIPITIVWVLLPSLLHSSIYANVFYTCIIHKRKGQQISHNKETLKYHSPFLKNDLFWDFPIMCLFLPSSEIILEWLFQPSISWCTGILCRVLVLVSINQASLSLSVSWCILCWTLMLILDNMASLRSESPGISFALLLVLVSFYHHFLYF